jgi:hypothetical protein
MGGLAVRKLCESSFNVCAIVATLFADVERLVFPE